LAEATGVPQSTIGRIESGAVVPRVDTLDRLLRACGDQLEAMPLLGQGVDRSLIAMMLAMTPQERFRYACSASSELADLKEKITR
jgi:predicted transcriptional regulator